MKKTKPPALTLLGEGAAEDFIHGQPERYVPSGLKSVDDIILGAVNGELTLIAGSPGQGKTSLAVQWAITAAQNGTPSAILSLEMGRRALRNRLISGISGIPMKMLRTRDWASAKHKKKAIETAEYLAEIPLYVDDRSGLDGQQVYDTFIEWGKQGIGIAFVDYVQRMAGHSESRVQDVGEAIRAIKSGAKDADIPIVAVSSLNRTATNSKPQFSHLRDTGELEYETDTLLMLHYPEDDRDENIRVCDIHIPKQRNGPTGVASVQFNKPATRFEEMDDERRSVRSED